MGIFFYKLVVHCVSFSYYVLFVAKKNQKTFVRCKLIRLRRIQTCSGQSGF